MSNAINQSIPVPYGKCFVKQMQHKFMSKAGVGTLMPGSNFTSARIERMRWKAFFLNQDQKRKAAEPTKRKQEDQHHKSLVEFKNALYKIISNIKFKNHNSKFQTEMKNDLNRIELSNKLFVFTDKSNNLYKVDKCMYENIFNEKLRTEYNI